MKLHISYNTQMSHLVRSVTHVHGTYEKDNIIFGIDATAVPPSDDAYIFTKTYRKMIQGTPEESALPRDIGKIKFYGHSLGQADYSYFQSIFDYYDLYDHTTLQFYFTIYDKSKEVEIKRRATEAVYKLITAFGDVLDNKDIGKTLLHKLLLEGRVQIKYLENL